MVSIRSLRTQQRAKSQCIKHIPPSMGWPSFFGGSRHHGDMPRSLRFCGVLSGMVCIPCGVSLRFVYMHSTESLILAQDERWRRA
jgi:hypothetical protein